MLEWFNRVVMAETLSRGVVHVGAAVMGRLGGSWRIHPSRGWGLQFCTT